MSLEIGAAIASVARPNSFSRTSIHFYLSCGIFASERTPLTQFSIVRMSGLPPRPAMAFPTAWVSRGLFMILLTERAISALLAPGWRAMTCIMGTRNSRFHAATRRPRRGCLALSSAAARGSSGARSTIPNPNGRTRLAI